MFHDYRKILLSVLFALTVLSSSAQYTVTGGSKGAPLLAVDDTRNRLQVWMVYGMNNVRISYTSSGGAVKWYRYQVKALEPESIAFSTEGNTTYISDMKEGYGYFVEEEGTLARYIWIIDYSQHAFTMNSLTVASGDCISVRLSGEPAVTNMQYYTPSGAMVSLQRKFLVSYKTLKWSDDSKSFSNITEVDSLLGNPYAKSVAAPLCDTEFTLSGDMFGEHFGVGQTMTTDTYQAVAVEVHADTTVVVDNSKNLDTSTGDALSAPVSVHFTAHANDPVASLYVWKIYNKETGEDTPLLRYTGPEVDYTFATAGTFVAALEVSSRNGDCSDDSNTFTFEISVSFLDVPNVFSPGTSPGVNDEFKVAYKSLIKYEIWIFNRWGNQLWHSTNPAEGWNGKNGNKYVSPGVYFYVINAKGSDGIQYHKKGSISILRSKTINDQVESSNGTN